MSNMSYCRFRNTLADLRDCEDGLYDIRSEEERRAARSLVKLCQSIASVNPDDLRVVPTDAEDS